MLSLKLNILLSEVKQQGVFKKDVKTGSWTMIKIGFIVRTLGIN